MKNFNCIIILLIIGHLNGLLGLRPTSNFERFNDFDLQQILNGVTKVKLDGENGQMVAFGENAFPILSGMRAGYALPIAAGGLYDQGRVIGFARIESDSIFQLDFADEGDISGQNFNSKFYSNIYTWLTSNKTEAQIALVGDYSADYIYSLISMKYQVTVLTHQEFESMDSPALTPFSTVVVDYNFPFSRVDPLLKYVANGGGLLIVAEHWEILGSTPESKDPSFYTHQFAPNHVMAAAGFLCSGEIDQQLQSHSGNDYPASVAEMKTLHVLDVWPLYEEALGTGDFSNFPTPQQIQTLSNLFWFIPSHVAEKYFAPVYETAHQFVNTKEFHPDFSDGQPVKENADRVKLLMFHFISMTILKNEDIVMHPGVPFFPNFETPAAKNAYSQKSKSKSLENNAQCVQRPKLRKSRKQINKLSQNSKPSADSTFPGSSVHTSDYIRRWYNTGYYAMAGKVVKVELNSEQILNDHSVQIGVHHDRWSYEGNSQFERLPILYIRKYIENNQVEVASPYGGSIFIQVPPESYFDPTYKPNVTVTGEGAVKAPVFEFGLTSLPEWRNTIRHYPGLWAEFKTDTISYIFPSSLAKTVENPDEALNLWTAVMAAFHDFTSTPTTNGNWRKDLIVMDYSSFAGAAHAGYPTVVPKEWKMNFINVSDMRDADEPWGLYHEIGHDFQEWDWWAIEGTSETTNNVLVLYIQETLFGHDPALKMEKQELKENIQIHLDNGRPYNEWAGDAWLALGTYYQLQVLYGWGAFKTVFTTYAQFTEEDKPQSGEEQTDLWIVTFSLVVNENLANFFLSWGVPLSPEGLGKIGHLPESLARMEDLLLM